MEEVYNFLKKCEVLYFENAKATFYSFTEAPRIEMLDV